MKPICASVSSAVIFLLLAIFGLLACTSALWQLFASFSDISFCLFLAAVCLVSGILTVLFLWCANRYGCLIRYENGTIKRRGLFGGFRKEIPVEAIRSITVTYIFRSGDFYILSDGDKPRFGFILKNCDICFYKSKRADAFVRSFWDGTIKSDRYGVTQTRL